MSTLIEAMVEADRPPAGTPCVVCKGSGHWCQAEQYTAGDAEVGICNACVEGQDCSYRLARKRREVAFELDPQDRPPAPVQTVPLAVQSAQHKEAIQLPAPVTTSQVAPVPTSRFEAIAARLLRLDPGETVAFATPDGMTVKSFDAALMAFLASYPPTEGVKWIHTPDPTKTRLIMATMKDLKRGVSKAKIEKPVKLEREPAVKLSQVKQEDDVNTYKPEQRAKAETLLKNGYGTQVVQDRTGLARNTVLKIKRELGMPVGVQQPSTRPVDAPQPDMTLSRAFELVIAEIDATVDSLKDGADDSEEMKNCIKSQEQLAGELRGWNPAQLGFAASAPKVSVYDRDMERAESELRLINLEIQRLTTRRDALKPVLSALKASATAERDTR